MYYSVTLFRFARAWAPRADGGPDNGRAVAGARPMGRAHMDLEVQKPSDKNKLKPLVICDTMAFDTVEGVRVPINR